MGVPLLSRLQFSPTPPLRAIHCQLEVEAPIHSRKLAWVYRKYGGMQAKLEEQWGPQLPRRIFPLRPRHLQVSF